MSNPTRILVLTRSRSNTPAGTHVLGRRVLIHWAFAVSTPPWPLHSPKRAQDPCRCVYREAPSSDSLGGCRFDILVALAFTRRRWKIPAGTFQRDGVRWDAWIDPKRAQGPCRCVYREASSPDSLGGCRFDIFVALAFTRRKWKIPAGTFQRDGIRWDAWIDPHFQHPPVHAIQNHGSATTSKPKGRPATHYHSCLDGARRPPPIHWRHIPHS